jgi:hypothetical protein
MSESAICYQLFAISNYSRARVEPRPPVCALPPGANPQSAIRNPQSAIIPGLGWNLALPRLRCPSTAVLPPIANRQSPIIPGLGWNLALPRLRRHLMPNRKSKILLLPHQLDYRNDGVGA